MKDRATGCAHGFGFFFFTGSSVALFGTEVTAPPSKAIVLFMPVFAYVLLHFRQSLGYIPFQPGYLSTPRHELASTLIQKQLQDSVTMRDRSEMAQLR
ncbi:hypothetical protein Bca4012_099140 [Brassica carinata]|uniref:Uncharacterized protein n=1 Tax=Brassica carinata TaxID=52824 RepID=A0A8X7TS92_BRACI|nr:hypothetical protein Bca52824_081792 [Brassica carinata]